MIQHWYDTINTAHPEDLSTREHYASASKVMTKEMCVSFTHHKKQRQSAQMSQNSNSPAAVKIPDTGLIFNHLLAL